MCRRSSKSGRRSMKPSNRKREISFGIPCPCAPRIYASRSGSAPCTTGASGASRGEPTGQAVGGCHSRSTPKRAGSDGRPLAELFARWCGQCVSLGPGQGGLWQVHNAPTRPELNRVDRPRSQRNERDHGASVSHQSDEQERTEPDGQCHGTGRRMCACAERMRTAGVEPARVAPQDPKSSWRGEQQTRVNHAGVVAVGLVPRSCCPA